MNGLPCALRSWSSPAESTVGRTEVLTFEQELEMRACILVCLRLQMVERQVAVAKKTVPASWGGPALFVLCGFGV